jgi:hypothetical protein
MKKCLIALIISVVTILAFSIPVFADKPDPPGGFGNYIAETVAQSGDGPGAAEEIVPVAQSINLGQFIKGSVLDEFDIPAKHEP